MSEYDESTYGERVAGLYDEWYPVPSDERMISTLAELAGGGRALELGIGTGRIALPLAAAGVEVHGIDSSQAMVARLRAKPGGERIPVTFGDFADVAVDGDFSLVFVVFNTFFNLGSQDNQVRCFQNVAKRLDEGGVFLIEAFVPDVARFDGGQTVRAVKVETDAVRLDVSQHDPVLQRVVAQQIFISGGRVELYPVELRYAWPSELDLMARLAGLRLRDRWDGWGREPFTVDSRSHISVYARS